MTDRRASALLVIDMQNDFCAGGALAVAGGDAVVPKLNRMIAWSLDNRRPIYATRDWHPADTKHFKAYGGAWPIHCVQHTTGALFHPDLHLPDTVTVVTTGDTRESEGYSAFEGHTPDGATLMHDLREQAIERLYVGGLATDYCVLHSVLDALHAGFKVTLLTDAIAAVNVNPDDGEKALDQMRAAGAEFTTTDAVLAE